PAPTGDAVDDETEFFRSPKTAIEKAIGSHPVVAAMKQAATETYQRKTTQQFLSEFPDAEKTINDPAFREWVSSSKIRTDLARQANENYDLEAAREIFGNWKALRGRQASAAGRKMYRRSDI